MKRKVRKLAVILIPASVMVLALVLSGCALVGPTVNVNGTWHVTAVTDPLYGSTSLIDDDLIFVQNGSTLTISGIFQGSVSGNKITFSLTYSGITLSFTGTVSGNKMSGTWTATSQGVTITGTWTATKVS